MTAAEEKKHKVAILSRSFGKASAAPFRYLEQHGIDYVLRRNDEPENTALVAELIGDADGVILGSEIIDRYVLDHCPRLRVISKHGVGLDAIDVELARQRGIAVCITPDANNETVADLTILLMLALLRDLRGNLITSSSPDWHSGPLSHDLFRATVGLIGYGKIGSGVARRLSGFEAEILVCDPHLRPEQVDTPGARLVGLEELLAKSDIISLHLPLTKQTEKMIDAAAISAMKDGALLINTSRGGLIDHDALREALNNGKLRGAGLDVYPVEPPVNEPLLELPNVVATPHIATHTEESNCRMGMAAVRNIVQSFRHLDAEGRE